MRPGSRPIHRPTATRGLSAALAAALLLLLLVAPTADAADSPSACALRGTTGWTDEGHDTDYSVFRRPVGTVKVGMLFVDFPDAPATEAPSEERHGRGGCPRLHAKEPGHCAGWGQVPLFAGSLSPIVA
ncbi:hypothetical protein [Streptomyces sp. KS 21]|uniref:hypothetical protein n=1 Tax=Streptomyces sp. KS 21 TaxID=2485150 RepID=UPI0010E0626B|nr:hypothetical protein EDD91_7461 [Streptomyces sp. KS 21]